MTVQAHAAALLALLDADNTPPALVVLDGHVPAGQQPPYVLVYLRGVSPEDAESRSMAGPSERFVLTATCHSVGATAMAARVVAQRVRAALLDVRPTVAGRSCFPIRHEESVEPQRDETTGVLLMDQVDVYRLESVPG